MNTCKGCGTPISQPRRGVRKWCSPRCRKQTLYGATCIDCGFVDNGSDGHRKPGTYRCFTCRSEHDLGDRNRGVAAAWNDGATLREIAESFDITPAYACSLVDYLRRHKGWDLPLRTAADHDRWDEIGELFLKGLTHREIGAIVGLSAHHVGARVQAMRRAGIDLPSRRGAAA